MTDYKARQNYEDCKNNEKKCNHDDGHDHHHDYNSDTFDTITVWLKRSYTVKELEACMNKAGKSNCGTLLRAKGIVKGFEGKLDVQYIPGDLKISPCTADGNAICFIGKKLNPKALSAAFDWK